MSSLVLDLQRDLLENTISTSQMLRKAIAVSKKLGVKEIEEWISNELNGYPMGGDIPTYRVIKGDLLAYNPYQGWIPVHMANAERAEILSRMPTGQSISELENLSASPTESCYLKYPKKIEKTLMDGMQVPMQPALHFQKAQIIGIIEKTRTLLLEWALDLEAKGILGEGMSFSREEKSAAGHITYNIKTLIGEINDSQLQQDTSNSNQTYNKTVDLDTAKRLVSELEQRIAELQLSEPQEKELKADISCIQSQLNSPIPKVAIVKESLSSIRNIIEGAAGSALFQGIITALNSML